MRIKNSAPIIEYFKYLESEFIACQIMKPDKKKRESNNKNIGEYLILSINPSIKL